VSHGLEITQADLQDGRVDKRRNLTTSIQGLAAVRHQVGHVQLPAQRLMVEDFNLVFERQRVLEIGIAVLPCDPHFYCLLASSGAETSSRGQHGNADPVAEHSRLVGIPGTSQGDRDSSVDRGAFSAATRMSSRYSPGPTMCALLLGATIRSNASEVC
jgi:hypothetical protein